MEQFSTGSAVPNRSGPRSRNSWPPPTLWIDTLHVFVLTAFAIGQPAYDRVGERPAYLVDIGVRAPAILLFVALFSLILPAVLAGLLWGVGRFVPAARGPVLIVVFYLLLTAAIAPFVNRAVFLAPWLAIGLSLSAGALAVWAYFRFRGLRSILTAAAPAIIIFPSLFLLHSPVARHFFFPTQKIETSRWNPVPVVIVLLDELCGQTLMNENREIDAGRFPNLAELGRTATWFRNATTVYPDTWQAVPAILSGKYPSTAWTPTVADRPQNLFSILDSTGAFESTVFEPVSRLASEKDKHAASRESGMIIQAASILPAVGRVLLYDITPDDLRERLPVVPRLWFGIHDDSVIDRQQRRGVFRYAKGDDRLGQFDHFLDCIEDSSQPQLLFFHVLLPHVPWCYLPSGRKCIPETEAWEILDDTLVDDELFVEHCQQRHLLQLAFADSQIGRVLDRLRTTGMFDNCLLIVAADHGISFKVGESRRGVSAGNRADIMSVPLFFKVPGQQSGVISDKNVETIDILPTITEILGIDLQLAVDGRSVFNAAVAERTEKRMYLQYQVGGDAPINVPAGFLGNSGIHKEIRQRFGPPSDPEALFRIGPNPELVGRAVVDRQTDSDTGVEIELTRSGSDYTGDPAALVPCYFEGRIVTPQVSDQPVALVVAINGTIRASTRTYRSVRFRDRFSAMVPESAFHEGANDVRWYMVGGPASAVRLTPCTVKTIGAE